MTVYFHTLGCKVNQYETQAMRRLLEDDGFDTAEFHAGFRAAEDGVLVINSCTVTGESDRKLRQLLRRARRDNPQAVIVLCGCMPQAFPARAAALADADIVLGNAERRTLPAKLRAYLTTRERTVDIPPHTTAYEPLSIREFQGRTRAFVKIEDGCNRFCSYCAIPYARGRVRSRALQDLKEEVEALAAAGYREVVLTGINLTAFGQDTGSSLADAVDITAAVEGIGRVRLGSLEPDHMTPALLDRLAAQPKLCPQFHLSLQSGCDATLRRMRRHYTTAEYAALCADLRRRFSNAAITTDIMVGFPAETEEEFAATLRFAEEIGFARAHIFAYSRREGTPAAAMAEQIAAAEKAARARRLSAVCEATRARYEEALVGHTVSVLLETQDDEGRWEGHTPSYVPVRVKATGTAGDMVTVRITARNRDFCCGTVE
ncbi:MAG: tRNA (N(6)-L-threonylcarbamoyladenosine(37)-C(2))-methylthiotransferase MtaB [Ruminococcaceae bacterium]|nr:tRNA (N(6)-L-threonylcarbamoyladenosine(37)-C(2))-methylthiotransferase MtaB [Oscillospiraceae bacterium]